MFTSDTRQIYFSLKGLKTSTKVAPFLHMMDNQPSKVKYQFFDMIGLPVGFESKTTPVFSLVSNTNVISVWTGNTVFNPSAGTIVVDLEKEKVAAGFFYILNLAADHRILVAEEPFR